MATAERRANGVPGRPDGLFPASTRRFVATEALRPPDVNHDDLVVAATAALLGRLSRLLPETRHRRAAQIVPQHGASRSATRDVQIAEHHQHEMIVVRTVDRS